MATKEELMARWDAFLSKIEDRFNESLAHAEESCIAQLQESDYDYETVMRSWQGMKATIRELIKKVDEVWQDKVEYEMRAVGDFWSDENIKRSELTDRLEDELGSFERQLEGKLSQLFYDHAIKLADKKQRCTQCNADIQIRNDLFRAQYITCNYCNAINTIAPETKFLKVGWGVVDNIAKIKCQAEFDAMETSIEAIQKHRGQAPSSYWDSYEKAYFNYWERFFVERIKLNIEAKERYDNDMARKRKEFDTYKTIQTK